MRTEFGGPELCMRLSNAISKAASLLSRFRWISVDILTLLTTLAEAAWISCCP
jgi:hypothetical protein